MFGMVGDNCAKGDCTEELEFTVMGPTIGSLQREEREDLLQSTWNHMVFMERSRSVYLIARKAKAK